MCQIKDGIFNSTWKGAGDLEIEITDFDCGVYDGGRVCILIDVHEGIDPVEEIVERSTGSVEIQKFSFINSMHFIRGQPRCSGIGECSKDDAEVKTHRNSLSFL